MINFSYICKKLIMAKGTIQSKAIMIIPFFIYLSKSRITNGTNVDEADLYPTSGIMYSLHITPFLMVSISIPVSRFKK